MGKPTAKAREKTPKKPATTLAEVKLHRLACNPAKSYAPHAGASFDLDVEPLDAIAMVIEGGDLKKTAIKGKRVTFYFSAPRTRLSSVLIVVAS